MKNKNGWEIKKVGKVCDILNGYAFKSSKYVDNGIRVIRITNVQKGKIVDDSPQFYPVSFEGEISKFLLYENDILISLTGNVGRVGLLNKTLLPAALNQRVACLRVKDELKISKDFMFHFLNSNIFEDDCINSAQGIAQKNMSTEWLKEYEIIIPPLPTQHQIVSELDALSEIISKKKQQIEELDKLAQAIFYDMFGDPVTNEKGWEVIKSKDFCSKITDGTHDTPERLTEGVKFITGKHIRANIIDYENSDYVTLDVHKEIFRRCNPEHGDVLYTNIGVNLGTAAINKVYYEFSMKNVALLKLKSEILNGYYLQYYLNNQEVRNHILDEFASGGAQKFLSLASIKRISVPIPTITLQSEFANKIESIESQKTLINQSIGDVQQLFDYTMDKYFN